MQPENYLNNPYYIRDPKHFMQGYNAYGSGAPNPYTPGGDWYESWGEGCEAADRYQAYAAAEAEREQTERERFVRDARARRTEKQKRHKDNKAKRAQEQSMLARKK